MIMHDIEMDYWVEMIEYTLEDVGALNALNHDQLIAFAEHMIICADQVGMALGHLRAQAV